MPGKLPIMLTTPHIACTSDDFAKTVIMPGDPLRAQYIASKYLQDAVLVNNVRGIQGYTGLYRGQRVSVMASGMGGPSMGIYSHELYGFMGVETIIRVGTCGSLAPNMRLGELVLAMGACTNSNFVSQFNLQGTFSPLASFELLRKAAETAAAMSLPYAVGNVVTMDYFYNDAGNTLDWAKLGVLACEMEAAILYTNAALFGKQALAILTVSDEVGDGGQMSTSQRETTLDNMIKLALAVSI